jgi:hypothetical protein
MIRSLSRAAAAMTLLSMATAVAAQGTSPAFSSKPFTDVPEGSAGYEGIEFLRNGNVLTGYEDGTFKPDNRLNRAELAKLIANPFILRNARVNECYTENMEEDDMTVFFPDVQRDAWYGPSICVVKTAKIVDGYDDGTYKPNRTINVAEAMKMLSSTFAFDTKTEPNDDWFMPYARALAERGAIPTSITGFADPITRGQMAEILYRLKADRQDKSSQSLSNIKKN